MPPQSTRLVVFIIIFLSLSIAIDVQQPEQLRSSFDDFDSEWRRQKWRQQRQKMKIHYLSSNTRAMEDGTSKRLFPVWNLSVVQALHLDLGSKKKGMIFALQSYIELLRNY